MLLPNWSFSIVKYISMKWCIKNLSKKYGGFFYEKMKKIIIWKKIGGIKENWWQRRKLMVYNIHIDSILKEFWRYWMKNDKILFKKTMMTKKMCSCGRAVAFHNPYTSFCVPLQILKIETKIYERYIFCIQHCFHSFLLNSSS